MTKNQQIVANTKANDYLMRAAQHETKGESQLAQYYNELALYWLSRVTA